MAFELLLLSSACVVQISGVFLQAAEVSLTFVVLFK